MVRTTTAPAIQLLTIPFPGVGRRSAQMKLIAKALDMAHHPENDLSRVQDQCHPGTCGWLTEDPGFQRWLGFDVGHDFGIGPSTQSPPRFLWLNGPPGSGKSVVSGQVIKYLSSYNLDCCYFFFKSDTKATVTELLLSLAYQMAEVNIEAREALLTMINNGDDVNTQDHTVIWNNLFIGRLFKIQFSQPLFWVMDALDECPKMSLVSLIQKMAKMDAAIPIRVFFTSRPDSPDAPVEQLLDEEAIKRVELQTGHGRSMHDIAAFIRSRPRLSRLLDEDKSNKILSTILEKSKGIFLWASLTVARLDQLYTLEDIEDALKEVPSEMNEFYAKILETVKSSSTADKAHCILKWVVCAASPMTVDELKEAVRLDIGQTILGSASGDVFSEMCGSLARTGNDGRIHWMHQTVKEFLTSPESGLYVNYREAHGRISDICLQHLLGKTFTRHSSRRSKPASTSAFAEYASANFSHHLQRSHSISPSLFSSVVQFTKTKSLVWIEHVARRGKLASFISTIQNIKPYLARQLERSPPFAADYQTISTWVNDLTRIVAIFGPTIIECPGSIYAFIPPLCPTSSLIHGIYAKASPQKIICASNETWEERLSSISCPAAAKAVATKDHFLAIGLMNGNIRIFNSSTLEELTVLSHRAPLRYLAFGNISNILASCSSGKLALWEPNHEQRWSAQIDGVASSVSFNADDSKIFITLSKNFKQEVLVFRTADGTPLDPLKIRLGEHDDSSDSSSNEGSKQVKRYCAEVVRFSPVLGYAAVTFRASHLTILSLDVEDNLEKLCRIQKGGTEDLRFAPDIHDVAFNPAVESDLVAVAYQDGDIVVFRMDEWNPEQLHVHSMHAYALASSPDGRTLAAGDTLGGVSLFAFDTLRLLHRTETLDEAVTRLIFASNSLRLYDVRGRSCNIWEPPVLVRKNSLDDNSTDPEDPEPVGSPEPKELAFRPFGDSKTITAITSAGDDGKLIFCGRDDGSVSVHELKSGGKVLDLKLHSASIQQVAWNPSARLLVTTDVSTRCIATRLSSLPFTSYSGGSAETLFNLKTSSPVLQVVIRPDGQTVLLSSQAGEEVWEGTRLTQSKHSLGGARWIQHPSDRTKLFLAEGDKLRLFHWAHLTEDEPNPRPEITISLGNAFTNLTLTADWVSRADTGLLVQMAQLPPTQSSQNAFVMLDVDKIPTQPASATVVQPSCAVRSFLGGIKAVLGLARSSVYFLTRSGWVCSMSLRSFPEPTSYTRHFFIPPFWRTEGEFLVKIVAKNSLVIANGDDLIVVHGFGDFEHKLFW